MAEYEFDPGTYGLLEERDGPTRVTGQPPLVPSVADLFQAVPLLVDELRRRRSRG